MTNTQHTEVNHYDILRVMEKAFDRAVAAGTITHMGTMEAMAEALAENFDITEPTGDACDYCDYGGRNSTQEHHAVVCPNNAGTHKHLVWP